MAESKEARNKALVLKAFDTLFNKIPKVQVRGSGRKETEPWETMTLM